jgi:hypothetical protein
MPIGAANYRQIATYWGSPEQGGFGGLTFAAPVVIKCRWEDRTEQFVSSQGTEKTSSAIVWTYDHLDDGGYLAKGDQTATSDPTALDGALEIQRSDEIPDLRGLHYERKAFL